MTSDNLARHGRAPGTGNARTHERRTGGDRCPSERWSAKRERQYEHIKEGLEKRGEDEDKAEEIAARTVNKERARAGEARTASRSSVKDISSGRRGGLRSHKGPGGRTKDQLYNEAKKQGHRGPVEDDQGRAGEGRRPLSGRPTGRGPARRRASAYR